MLSMLLQKALDLNIVTHADFYKTDEEVITLLKESNNAEIVEGIKKMEGELTITQVEQSNEAIKLQGKFRYIDPDVVVDQKLVPLSILSKEYKIFLETEKEKSSEEVYVTIV
ncbi:MAG: hypothetical protein ACMXYK_00685 [Candidatus Woesearchaeota archaeon]